MRIAIDARYVADHFPGIGRYVFNTTFALAGLLHGHTLHVLYSRALPNTRYDLAALGSLPNVELIEIREPPFSLAQHHVIPRLLRRLGADLYHAPYYLRPYLGLPCPSVTTLYDAIPRLFPQEVSPRARLLFDTLTRASIRASRRVITISASARADLAAAYAVAAERIAVTPLAADERFRPQPPEVVAAVRARYALPERYLLTLASNKPHKNLETLIEAFARATSSLSPPLWTLVVAGHWDPRYPAALEMAERLGLGERVRWLPNVADADLPGLYSGAAVFAFPSRYEGFGLPPLEALACGVPVLCGAVSSLPEVVGDAAVLVDVTSSEALAGGLSRVLSDEALRAELSARGPEQAARFSWRRTAELTLAVYEACA